MGDTNIALHNVIAPSNTELAHTHTHSIAVRMGLETVEAVADLGCHDAQNHLVVATTEKCITWERKPHLAEKLYKVATPATVKNVQKCYHWRRGERK